MIKHLLPLRILVHEAGRWTPDEDLEIRTRNSISIFMSNCWANMVSMYILYSTSRRKRFYVNSTTHSANSWVSLIYKRVLLSKENDLLNVEMTKSFQLCDVIAMGKVYSEWVVRKNTVAGNIGRRACLDSRHARQENTTNIRTWPAIFEAQKTWLIRASCTITHWTRFAST